MLEPLTYQDLLEAQELAKAAKRQFRLMLNNAGYEETKYDFVNGIIVIALHPDYVTNCKTEVNSWRELREWCFRQPHEAFFIVEGHL